MKRLLVLFALPLLVFASCSERGIEPQSDTGAAINLDPEYLAGELIAQTGWPDVDGVLRTPEGCGNIIEIEREEVAPSIAHYSFLIRIGEGDYDLIKLHRVVKECKPNTPIRTCKSVFFQHGDGVGFAGMVLYGALAPSVPADRSMAVYLAQNGVDVWGIDQNWILVPQDVTDFSFMADWGIQNQVENLDIAISTARYTRMLAGGNRGKMHLIGYSSGVWTGYAYVNWETQKPACERNVGGFIPVDAPFKTDDDHVLTIICGAAVDYQALYDSGQYGDPVPFAPVGYLAITDPDGDSPIALDYTNYEVAMLFGSATHVFFPYVPWFHYVAGEFDEYGMPTGMRLMTDQAWFEFMLNGCAWEPVLFQLDYLQTCCGTEDVPWDDHLADIKVPIFNLGSVGGIGTVSEYTLTLLGSCDVTSLIVQLYSPEEIYVDFGHIDIFTAENAEALVWVPVLEWLDVHSCSHDREDLLSSKE